jgi:FkbM family methyltransferase
MSYSQNNEEAVVLQHIEKLGLLSGNFLDIGAYDGKTFSNTLRLAELGWSGVCVEPSPSAFIGLLKTHRENRNVALVNAAIAPSIEWLEFYDSNGDAISSSNTAHVHRWSVGTIKFSKFHLVAVSITDLLTRFGYDFTFVNLDVEGQNWSIFQAFPWHKMLSTKIICVEHDVHQIEIIAALTPLNFVAVAENAENIILVRD